MPLPSVGALRSALQLSGGDRLGSDYRASHAGYGSAGEQPERRASPKGAFTSGSRAGARQARDLYLLAYHSPWPNAENSGGGAWSPKCGGKV
jgi:hypothetical protein